MVTLHPQTLMIEKSWQILVLTTRYETEIGTAKVRVTITGGK